jgi:hypothetical protein
MSQQQRLRCHDRLMAAHNLHMHNSVRHTAFTIHLLHSHAQLQIQLQLLHEA